MEDNHKSWTFFPFPLLRYYFICQHCMKQPNLVMASLRSLVRCETTVPPPLSSKVHNACVCRGDKCTVTDVIKINLPLQVPRLHTSTHPTEPSGLVQPGKLHLSPGKWCQCAWGFLTVIRSTCGAELHNVKWSWSCDDSKLLEYNKYTNYNWFTLIFRKIQTINRLIDAFHTCK